MENWPDVKAAMVWLWFVLYINVVCEVWVSMEQSWEVFGLRQPHSKGGIPAAFSGMS